MEELEVVIKEPMRLAPTRNVWIHEGLEDEARRLWETYTCPEPTAIETGQQRRYMRHYRRGPLYWFVH